RAPQCYLPRPHRPADASRPAPGAPGRHPARLDLPGGYHLQLLPASPQPPRAAPARGTDLLASAHPGDGGRPNRSRLVGRGPAAVDGATPPALPLGPAHWSHHRLHRTAGIRQMRYLITVACSATTMGPGTVISNRRGTHPREARWRVLDN